MNVLLSIKPTYIEEIQKGNKGYEFRRAIFKNKPDEIVIYASSPVKKIIGSFSVGEIIEDTPDNLWNNFKEKAGINKKDFFEYFKGKTNGFALEIKEFKPLSEPFDPYKNMPQFRPPQSFAYINNLALAN